MEETGEANHSANSSRKPESSPGRWRKVTAGLPWLFLMLLILAMVIRPGQSFIDGQTSGIYWLYFRIEEIWGLTFGATVVSCAFWLVLTVCRKSLDRFERTMMIPNTVLFVLGLGVIPLFGPATYATHLDTAGTEEHIYYLAKSGYFDRYWVPYYLVFKCDSLGLICQRIHRSEDQYNSPNLNGSLEFDQSTGEIQLIDKDEVIYTYQQPP